MINTTEALKMAIEQITLLLSTSEDAIKYCIDANKTINACKEALESQKPLSDDEIVAYKHLHWCVEQYRNAVSFDAKQSTFQSVCEAADAIEQAHGIK